MCLRYIKKKHIAGGQMDRQCENNIPLPQTVCRGYKHDVSFYNIDVTEPDHYGKYFKLTVWFCNHKRHIVDKKSNENHKQPYSKIIGYWLYQCDAIRINTAIWDKLRSDSDFIWCLHKWSTDVFSIFHTIYNKTLIICWGVFKVLKYICIQILGWNIASYW